MDNLQQHYLRLLKGAQQKALEGEFEECLNICFDLRLKPDLALYTRAMVCLTICDFIHTRSLPEKVEMANDALRIAKELKEEPNSQRDSFWIETYNELLQDAEKAVERAEEERKEEEAVPTFRADDIEGIHDDEEELIEIEVPPRENAPEVIGMPKIEGVFTNHPATAFAAAAAEGQGSGDSDTGMGRD